MELGAGFGTQWAQAVCDWASSRRRPGEEPLLGGHQHRLDVVGGVRRSSA